jgi:two-component system, response regulator
VSRRRVVLLVEDNADDVALTLRAFSRSERPPEVVVASDGAAALDLLLGSGESAPVGAAAYRMVLLDLKLPKIDGLEVLRQIRLNARTRRLPVIILTSSDHDRDVATSYDLGANSFLRKPVDFTCFIDTARQIERYWLDLNEPPPDVESMEARE